VAVEGLEAVVVVHFHREAPAREVGDVAHGAGSGGPHRGADGGAEDRALLEPFLSGEDIEGAPVAFHHRPVAADGLDGRQPDQVGGVAFEAAGRLVHGLAQSAGPSEERIDARSVHQIFAGLALFGVGILGIAAFFAQLVFNRFQGRLDRVVVAGGLREVFFQEVVGAAQVFGALAQLLGGLGGAQDRDENPAHDQHEASGDDEPKRREADLARASAPGIQPANMDPGHGHEGSKARRTVVNARTPCGDAVRPATPGQGFGW